MRINLITGHRVLRITLIHFSFGVFIMSKPSKNKHYALSQMRELRKDFVAMRDQWEKDPRAVMQRKAQLRAQLAEESMQEWESIKRQSKQLRLL
jgi:hypothetical protein